MVTLAAAGAGSDAASDPAAVRLLGVIVGVALLAWAVRAMFGRRRR